MSRTYTINLRAIFSTVENHFSFRQFVHAMFGIRPSDNREFVGLLFSWTKQNTLLQTSVLFNSRFRAEVDVLLRVSFERGLHYLTLGFILKMLRSSVQMFSWGILIARWYSVLVGLKNNFEIFG